MWKTQKKKADIENDECEISWNANQRLAQPDLLRDMVQAEVAMFQETQQWKKDGIAGEIGWRLFRAENGGKATVAVKRRHLGRLRHPRESRWDPSRSWRLIYGKPGSVCLGFRRLWFNRCLGGGYAQSRAACWSGNATEQRH